MKKRKLLSLLLAGAMVFGLLAGCGGGTQNEPSDSESPAPGAESPPAARRPANL